MRLHPDSSQRISVSELKDLYASLREKHTTEDVDYFKKLQESSDLSNIAKLCSPSEEALLSSKYFSDLSLFSNWCDEELRQDSYGSSTSVKKNNSKKSKTEKNQTIDGTPLAFIPPIPPPCNIEEELDSELGAGVQKFNLDQMLSQSGLKTLSFQSRSSCLGHKRPRINELKIIDKRAPLVAKGNEKEKKLTENDLVYQVAIYFPGRSPIKPLQKFLVLGDQKLSCLRDSMFCEQDFLSRSDPLAENECDENIRAFNLKLAPAKQTTVTLSNTLNTANQKTSPSYFFFDNTFYSDNRSGLGVDYSEQVIAWANASGSKQKGRIEPARQHSFSELHQKDMTQTTFDELCVRLHQPYLFCHQGNCQHIVIINSIRLFHPKIDPPKKSAYPHLIFQSGVPRKSCHTCSVFKANHITVNDVFGGESPLFQCDQCFDLLHLDEQKKPLYSFLHYPYYQK